MARFTSLLLLVLATPTLARHPAAPPPDLFQSIKSTSPVSSTFPSTPSSTVVTGNSLNVSPGLSSSASAASAASITTEPLAVPEDLNENATIVSRGGGAAGATQTRTLTTPNMTSDINKDGMTESASATIIKNPVTETPASSSSSTVQKADASTSVTAKTTKAGTGLEEKEVVVGKGMKGNNKAVRLYNRLFHSKSQHKSIAKKLKNRNHTNLRRKVLHCSFGLCFTALNHFIPKQTFVPCMTILTSATLLMELLRYQHGFGWMNDVLHGILGSSLRKHEMEGKFTGSFYFFLGVTVTAALLDKPAACMGIAQLALADPSASYFGRQTRHIYWSRIENGLGGFGRNKGLLGFLGGAVFCVPFNYRVLSLAKFGANSAAATAVPVSQTALLAASFALGLAGAFADLAVPTPAVTLPKKILGCRVPPFHLDDNFVVPIVSGFAATKIFAAAGLGPANSLQLARFMIFP
jgi:dolichol kinase